MRSYKEKLTRILKAVLRPTPAQKTNQKATLERYIGYVQKGIASFDRGMAEFSKAMASMDDTLSEQSRKERNEKMFGPNQDDPRKYDFLIGGERKKFFSPD